MRIAVTTPSGHVGRHVVRSLLRAGVRPLVLTRNPDGLDEDVRGAVDAVALDLGDADALTAATVGVDALHLVVPSPFGDPDPIAAYERVARAAAQAVEQNTIARTVLQSSVGAEVRHGAGEIDGLARVEEALDAVVDRAGLGVVHLRCGFFFTNLLLQLDDLRRGTVAVLLPTGRPMPWVAPRDIAEVAAGWLLRTDWTGRRVHAVHGPADLSWEDATATVTRVTGHPVRAERVSDDDLRAILRDVGLNDAQVEALVGMSVGLRDGFTPEQPRDVTTTTPTTLAAWAHDELAPALRADR